MTSIVFNPSPLHQAIKNFLWADGVSRFGNTRQILGDTMRGSQATIISYLRGQISLGHLALGLWSNVEAEDRRAKSPWGAQQARRDAFQLLWSGGLLLGLTAQQKETLTHAAAEVIAESSKNTDHGNAEAWQRLMDQPDPFEMLDHRNSAREMAQETLWTEVFRNRLSCAQVRNLLETSIGTMEGIYRDALSRGAEDAVAINLGFLAQRSPASEGELAAAHEMVCLGLILDDPFYFQAIPQFADDMNDHWPAIFSMWEGACGLVGGTMSSLLAEDGWLYQFGCTQPLKALSHWMRKMAGPILPEDARNFSAHHATPTSLFVALLKQSFRPIAPTSLELKDFSHLGIDLDNLSTFGKAQRPLRLLLVGENGVGKSSMARLLATMGHAIPVEAVSEDGKQESLVCNLRLLQQTSVFGKAMVVIDPGDSFLNKDANVLRWHLLSASQRQKMKASEVWTLRSVKDVPTELIHAFDLVVSMGSMPLAQRQTLALKHFEPDMAHRLAQMCASPGEIEAVASWAEASGRKDWTSLSARLSGIQSAILQSKEATGGLPLQVYTPAALRQGFESVVGLDDSVRRARQLIACLQNPTRFATMGGKAPKGALLTGGPGTGKTHMARAMAVEAGVPFLLADSAAMARNPTVISAVFAEARRQAPCILFLDELDAIGTAAKGILGGSPDPERQGILNRLLMELDGFEALDGVLVVGATHRSELLDEALVRSGRLGWHIHMPTPDTRSRLALWKHYAKTTQCADTIDWERIARVSSGMSPADITHALNAAVLEVVRDNRERVSYADIVQAIDETLWHGGVVDMHLLEEERWKTAVHESGHALIAWQSGVEIERASIRPRQKTLGHVRMLNEEGRVSESTADLFAQVAISFGGLGAEEVIFGHHSTGASGDLEHVRSLARKAIRQEGMSQTFPAGIPSSSSDYVSPHLLARVERLENDMVRDIRKSTIAWLSENKGALETFAHALLKAREMDGHEAERLLGELLPDHKGSRVATLALAARGLDS